VPLARGKSKSKNFDEVIKEAKKLVLADKREIVLTGVNLGAFGKDSLNPDFAIAKIRPKGRQIKSGRI